MKKCSVCPGPLSLHRSKRILIGEEHWGLYSECRIEEGVAHAQPVLKDLVSLKSTVYNIKKRIILRLQGKLIFRRVK